MRLNLMGGGVDISLPNVSYCEDVKDIHYNPYNTVEFYVGEITEPQTVKIYTDSSTSVDVTVSEGSKWYAYLLPKEKGLCKIEGDSVKKVLVKSNISFEPNFRPPFYHDTIIPISTVEASFKGSKLNITDIEGIFQGCRSLTSLDVNSFDTSNVTSMDVVFSGCTSLTSLDVSNFNTSNVTTMVNMFGDCSNLTSLTLSNFNTSKVTSMSYMFYNCNSLTSLDLSGWNTSKVTSMSYMFYGCAALNKITMKGCSEATRTKIQNQLAADGITGVTIVTE